MRTYELIQFPMSISVNDAYRNLNRPGMRGRVKTAAYKQFEKRVDGWKQQRWAHVNHLLTSLAADLARPGVALHVHRHFFFDPARIRCLDGRPRRLDVTNYVKVLDDALSKIIGVDDCYFWDDTTDRHYTPDPSCEEWIDITFTVIPMPGVPQGHRTPEAIEAARLKRSRKGK